MLRHKAGLMPQPAHICCQPGRIVCCARDRTQSDQVGVMHLFRNLFNEFPNRDCDAAGDIDRAGHIRLQQL